MSRIKILVASRSEVAADAVTAKLRDHDRFDVKTRVVMNGHADPLHDVHPRPDLLILHYVPGYGELEYLATLSPNQRPRLLVFGPAGDANAMRLAMRAGASDYLPEPLAETDLMHGLDQVCEGISQRSGSVGQLVTVINSKGGSGASIIAANLACTLAKNESRRTALLDMDLQFGGLARYLDLTPERGLAEALDLISDMDQAAAEAFVTPHASGVELVAAPSGRLVHKTHYSAEQIDAVVHIFLQNHDHVVVDLPRHIDAFSSVVLERSDRVLIVVQQSLAHIDGAARLMRIISSDLGLRRERVEVVVNRFAKNSVIELDDIRKTLGVDQLHIVPNQYRLVAESIDTGKPVVQSARNSTVARALRELGAKVCGTNGDDVRRGNFLTRTLPNVFGAN